jgi:hypothetical protein
VRQIALAASASCLRSGKNRLVPMLRHSAWIQPGCPQAGCGRSGRRQGRGCQGHGVCLGSARPDGDS